MSLGRAGLARQADMVVERHVLPPTVAVTTESVGLESNVCSSSCVRLVVSCARAAATRPSNKTAALMAMDLQACCG